MAPPTEKRATVTNSKSKENSGPIVKFAVPVSAARVTDAAPVIIGLVAKVPTSHCATSTAITSPLVTSRKPITGLATVAAATLKRCHALVNVMAVQDAPLSCVISTVPVPVMRRAKKLLTCVALADVMVCSAVPLAAVAVSREAVLAAPSMPVTSSAAVMFVLTHVACVKSRECKAMLVRAPSVSKPRAASVAGS